MLGTRDQPIGSVPIRSAAIAAVRMIATGSFKPLSNSMVSPTRLRSGTPSRMANTAAASVEETMAPTSSASGQLRPSTRAPTAVIPATPITPTVANTVAGPAAPRMCCSGVSKLPENRMTTRASVPNM